LNSHLNSWYSGGKVLLRTSHQRLIICSIWIKPLLVELYKSKFSLTTHHVLNMNMLEVVFATRQSSFFTWFICCVLHYKSHGSELLLFWLPISTRVVLIVINTLNSWMSQLKHSVITFNDYMEFMYVGDS